MVEFTFAVLAFPGSSVVRISLQCWRCGFYRWIGKNPWRRKWQPIPLFLPGKSHGQRSLAGSMGSQRIGNDWATNTFTFCCPFWQPHLPFLWSWIELLTISPCVLEIIILINSGSLVERQYFPWSFLAYREQPTQSSSGVHSPHEGISYRLGKRRVSWILLGDRRRVDDQPL